MLTLNQLIDKLTETRDRNPEIADKVVTCEDSEMGMDYGNDVVGITATKWGVSVRITNLEPKA